MRPLSREEPVGIYSQNRFRAATQEGSSFYSTRTASQLPRLSVPFDVKVLSPSQYFIDQFYFIIVTYHSIVNRILYFLRKSDDRGAALIP